MLHEAMDIIPKFLSKKTVPIIIKNNAINIFFILAKYIKKSSFILYYVILAFFGKIFL